MFLVFKQKTAYDLRISDWSSDVCSSDLGPPSLRSGRPPRQARRIRPSASESLSRFSSENFSCDSIPFFTRWMPRLAGWLDAAWRSEERRGGKEGVSTVRSRWSLYH